FSFFAAHAILSSCPDKGAGWQCRKRTSFTSAENSPAAKMDASLPPVMGMETCWRITVVHREKIFAMRSERHEAQSPAGRNTALICGAKFYIAQPKCWKGAASSWKASLAALTALGPGRAAK